MSYGRVVGLRWWVATDLAVVVGVSDLEAGLGIALLGCVAVVAERQALAVERAQVEAHVVAQKDGRIRLRHLIAARRHEEGSEA